MPPDGIADTGVSDAALVDALADAVAELPGPAQLPGPVIAAVYARARVFQRQGAPPERMVIGIKDSIYAALKLVARRRVGRIPIPPEAAEYFTQRVVSWAIEAYYSADVTQVEPDRSDAANRLTSGAP